MAGWLLHPAGQVALFALIEAAALFWLIRSRRRPALIAAIAVPVACAVVLVADALIDSPRERVDRAIGAIRRGVIDGDAEAVLARIDPAYDFDGLTYDALATWLPAILDRYNPDSVRIVRREFTEVADDRIRVRLDVISSSRTGALGTLRSSWTLTFLPAADRWLLAEIDPISINGHLVGSLTDLPG